MFKRIELLPPTLNTHYTIKEIFSEIGIISAAQYKFMNSALNTKFILVPKALNHRRSV